MSHVYGAPPSNSTPTANDEESPRNGSSSHDEGVITVGGRASLPTLYVADETPAHNGAIRAHNLRFRNCSQESGAGGNTRSTPNYGTPGSFSSTGSLPDSGVAMDEQPADDSGFRYIPHRPHRTIYEAEEVTADGSFFDPPPISPTTTLPTATTAC